MSDHHMKYILYPLIVVTIMLITISRCDCNSPTEPGEIQPEIRYEIEVYDSLRALNGSTLLADLHNADWPRVVELNMAGEVIWSYTIPTGLREYTSPGIDVEKLENGNVMILFPGWGILELTTGLNVVWHHEDAQLSHDADRLPDRSTLYVFGNQDSLFDYQVKEVAYNGLQTWGWRAAGQYSQQFEGLSNRGWSHTNSVTRLTNGNTLVCLRNFHLIAEVTTAGQVAHEWGEGILHLPYDPELLANGNILVANQADTTSGRVARAVEFDPQTNTVVWEYLIPDESDWPVRDADRLSNGNTLITCATSILEVASGGDIVWRMRLKDVTLDPGQAEETGLYKAERIAQN